MSVSFYIKNKKKFFGYEKVMKVREVIDLFKEYKLSFYNIDFHSNDPNGEKFYNTSIESWQENNSCILFGVESKSMRGFELSYNTRKNSYVIKEFTPATENDWLIVLEYMKLLAEKLGSKIISDEGNNYNFEAIKNFDYKKDTLNVRNIHPYIHCCKCGNQDEETEISKIADWEEEDERD